MQCPSCRREVEGDRCPVCKISVRKSRGGKTSVANVNVNRAGKGTASSSERPKAVIRGPKDETDRYSSKLRSTPKASATDSSTAKDRQVSLTSKRGPYSSNPRDEKQTAQQSEREGTEMTEFTRGKRKRLGSRNVSRTKLQSKSQPKTIMFTQTAGAEKKISDSPNSQREDTPLLPEDEQQLAQSSKSTQDNKQELTILQDHVYSIESSWIEEHQHLHSPGSKGSETKGSEIVSDVNTSSDFVEDTAPLAPGDLQATASSTDAEMTEAVDDLASRDFMGPGTITTLYQRSHSPPLPSQCEPASPTITERDRQVSDEPRSLTEEATTELQDEQQPLYPYSGTPVDKPRKEGQGTESNKKEKGFVKKDKPLTGDMDPENIGSILDASASFTSKSYKEESGNKTILHLHAIASKDFLKNPSQMKVAIESKQIGRMIMKVSNPQDDIGTEISLQIQISWDNLGISVLEYSYTVIQDGVRCADEFAYDSNIEDTLCSPRKVALVDVGQGIWHQHDGILKTFPDQKDFHKKNIQQGLKKDLKNYITCCKALKDIESEMKSLDNLKDALNHVEMMYKSLKAIYFTRTRIWEQEEQFLEFFGRKLKQVLDPSLQKLAKEEKISFSYAIGTMCIANTFGLKIEKSISFALCKALQLDTDGEKRTRQLKIIQSLDRKKIEESLKHILQPVNMQDLTWMSCLPLFHFITGLCQPFDEVSEESDYDAERWWGTSGILEYPFGSKLNKWKGSELLTNLSPFFGMDYYLPRTLTAALELDELAKIVDQNLIPPEVLIARLVTFGPKKKFEKDKYLKPCLICLKNVNHQLQEILQLRPESCRQKNRTSAILCAKIGSHLMKKGLQNSALFILTTTVWITAVCICETIREQTNFEVSAEIFESIGDCISIVTSWIENNSKKLDITEFKVWKDLLDKRIPNERIRKQYTEEVVKIMKKILAKKSRETSFVEQLFRHFCENKDIFPEAVIQDVENISYKAMETENHLKREFLNEKGKQVYWKILSTIFEKTWSIKGMDFSLEAILSWSSMTLVLEKHGKSPKSGSETNLKKIIDILKQTEKDLQSGEITMKNLSLIVEKKKEKFCKCMKAIGHHQNLDFLISIRESELQAIRDTEDKLRNLILASQHFDDNSLNSNGQWIVQDNFKMNEFCIPCDVTSMNHQRSKIIPQLTFFDLLPNEIPVLKTIERLLKGMVFLTMWKREGAFETQRKGQTLNIKELINVGQRVMTIWTEFRTRIIDGTIAFKEFEKYFGNMSKKSNLYEELHHFDDTSAKWKEERVRQIEHFRNLKHCVEFSCVVINIVKELALSGDFTTVKKIAQLADKTESETQMNDFDESLITICDEVKEISSKQISCIAQLSHCKELVKWIQEDIKDLQGLSVFVELAKEQVEGDLQIGKINCFQSAAIGYAPLILNVNKKWDYKAFHAKCRLVWRELELSPNLPDKLIDTKKHLKWLQGVKEIHGSIEISSMKQARDINDMGVYFIGNLGNNGKRQKLILGDVLELHVMHEKELSDSKKYTYKELEDLQSKLMLTAGKSEKTAGAQTEHTVARFSHILECVERIGRVYIKLVESGCILFMNWHVKFVCNSKRKVCAFIYFGTGNDVTILKGEKKDEKQDVTTIIPQIAKFMEDCLQSWKQYIDDKREEYFHLNFYTITQIVILQKELANVLNGKKPSKFIIPLLSLVSEVCSHDTIIQALERAQWKLEKTENDQFSKKAEKYDMSGEEDEKDTFIRKMQDAGYKEELAIAALRNVHPHEINKGLMWCMDNEFDYKKVESKAQKTINQKSLRTTTREVLFMNLTNEGTSGLEYLIKELKTLWDNFLTSIFPNISDYLSLEFVSRTLKELSSLNRGKMERGFLQCFTMGEPNLLICPKAEVISTLLTIYSHDFTKPFPQSDEVLFCTENTTLDQIEIFWKRTLSDNTGKIFSLVHPELLKHTVSEKADKKIDFQKQNSSISYKLIIICSSEKQFSSPLVSAVDKYGRPCLPLKTQQELQKYVMEKLICTEKKSAAALDVDKSTVRVVKSWRAGMGKTLYKKRLADRLINLSENDKTANVITIPLHERKINIDEIMSTLLMATTEENEHRPRIIHIDIAYEVEDGVDYLLFQLLILGNLSNSQGKIWRKLPSDLYLVETLRILEDQEDAKKDMSLTCVHTCLNILPDIICRTPVECLEIYSNPTYNKKEEILFDDIEFRSVFFQRPYQYLCLLDAGRDPSNINLEKTFGSKKECLEVILRHCGVQNPSWAEVRNFIWFLNTQLDDFEKSDFVSEAASGFLPGFSKFVLKFLIQMSRDFSTRSLEVSEESPCRKVVGEEEKEKRNDKLDQYKFRRTWESSPHPYLFFNPDHNTMTFVGFTINRWTRHLIDYRTKKILEKEILSKELNLALYQNNVNLQEDFDSLSRHEKLKKLCTVMGLKEVHDPDETYELTMDNVKKILAIYMRFRCDIPVIIMGETGCGKTRLIEFLCKLQLPHGAEVTNMIKVKVHGGIGKAKIIKKVKEAERIAGENTYFKERLNTEFDIYTVLFFDEANTTEAIGIIKEIMCDRSVNGEPLRLSQYLKIVAACNPYRKHSEEMIDRLEQAGLGYHVDAQDTTDRLGRVPMRRLVYRVQPLPQSMLPFVWDFGQLSIDVEEKYIKQMVLRYARSNKLPLRDGLEGPLTTVLTKAQEFMRNQKGECSFVSLRDVERVLNVMCWFYEQRREFKTENGLLCRIQDAFTMWKTSYRNEGLLDLSMSLVLALGVCYHACLTEREKFREYIIKESKDDIYLPEDPEQMLSLIERCQDVFLENVDVGENIAKNKALRENIFMMVICIELRIPLFLVGRPGSSKSISKTIISQIMTGVTSPVRLYESLKQVTMFHFQCSHNSQSEDIIRVFEDASEFQRSNKKLENFVGCVVLDEIGLAEDSAQMPLKILHPLLENGCHNDEEAKDWQKVAFVGISNWALDPAKMNRGILVQREPPSLDDLVKTARDICSNNNGTELYVDDLMHPLAQSYHEIFKASLEWRGFFGLRDFYSLVKMIFRFADTQRKKPTWVMLEDAVWRNFDGLDDPKINPFKIFEEKLQPLVRKVGKAVGDPELGPRNFIKSCMKNENDKSRHFLLLTENFGAVSILQQHEKFNDAVVIYGSSFPCDQKYTQVCRDINRIKVSMERGDLVILLNLEVLYESLYDVLNQYYVHLGGEQYVDIGLGTHRVKCNVHENFRIIVVAEKTRVYEKYPVPLINRLEKHFLNTSSLLTPIRQQIVDKLKVWVSEFVEKASFPEAFGVTRRQKRNLKEGNVFIGYHQDTCASVITYLCRKNCMLSDELLSQKEDHILMESKKILLWCATPDAVLRCNMDQYDKQKLSKYQDEYFVLQQHESLSQCLVSWKDVDNGRTCLQVTTHSKLLTEGNLKDLAQSVGISVENTALVSLQSFDTEQQFCFKVQHWFDNKDDSLLIVQCEFETKSENVIACARHCIADLRKDCRKTNFINYVVLIIHIPRKVGISFTGFQCGDWRSVHIDELSSHETDFPRVPDIIGKTISELLEYGTVIPEHGLQEVNKKEHRTSLKDLNMDEISQHDMNKGQVATERRFNIKSLVKDSVQQAVTMIIENEGNIRASERVKILLKWLNHDYEDESLSLLNGICNHLKLLIKEKEQTVSCDEQLRWLHKEATSWEYISRAGTFRKALKQCIQNKLAPFFAAVIASIDYNQNMMILEYNQTISWQHRLWLKILSNPQCTGLNFQLFRHDLAINEKHRFVIKNHSCSGFPFGVTMPHVWIIYELVSNTMKAVKIQSSAGNLSKCLDLLEKCCLGQILKKIGKPNEILESYLNDFIYIVYPVSSNEEHCIIFKYLYAIVNGTTTSTTEEENENVLRRILDVHFVFEKSQAQLKRFKRLVQIWPGCCDAIDSEEGSLEDKYDLDSLGLMLLLKTMEPSMEIFTDTNGKRKEWIRKLNKYRSITEQILESNSQRKGTHDLVEKLKQRWFRFTVVKLFIDHVCLKKEYYFRRCMSLFTMLEDNALKSLETLETIEKFLTICMKETRRKLYGEQQTCKACNTGILGRSLKLPCKCIICSPCHREITVVRTMEKKCPNCQYSLPKDFKAISVHGKTMNDDQLEGFIKCCNGFFMAFVSQICFSDDIPPADNVVKKLLSYISVNIGKEDGVMSRKLALFSEGMDTDPVVRTYLLKQLLRTNPKDVKDYLKTYIDNLKAMFESDSDVFF